MYVCVLRTTYISNLRISITCTYVCMYIHTLHVLRITLVLILYIFLKI
jgi:hypothetical protein